MASQHSPANGPNGPGKPVNYRNSPTSDSVSPSRPDPTRYDRPTLDNKERAELSNRDPVNMLNRARVVLKQRKAGVRRYSSLASTIAYRFALVAARDATIIDRLVEGPVFRERKYKPDKSKVLHLAVCYALDGIIEGDPNYDKALRTVTALEAAFERRDTPESVFAQLVERGVSNLVAEGRERRSEAKGNSRHKAKVRSSDAADASDSADESDDLVEGEEKVVARDARATNSGLATTRTIKASSDTEKLVDAPDQSLNGFVELRMWVPERSLSTALSGPNGVEKDATYRREGRLNGEWLLKGRL